MPDPDLSLPLITSDQPEVFISIDDDGEESVLDNQDQHPPRGFEFDHLNNPVNPFGFLSDAEPPVQNPTTVDPFRNDTPGVCGLYEAVKIVICLPIALVRLVLFGVSLAVGYLATKVALAGWRDRHNPMPRWRCRIMWVTRFCTRCILFSLGQFCSIFVDPYKLTKKRNFTSCSCFKVCSVVLVFLVDTIG
ncbi:hypothetical protein Bca52824_003260 [Brassica carinata]|uniref:Uncharacterized protein n=1 Tax=Brassica carinata TaxID=52824 RepID=A0A8X8BEL1_BRACI|nr:hypothetical protein Bca52824_003260 [Brassica carinata]